MRIEEAQEAIAEATSSRILVAITEDGKPVVDVHNAQFAMSICGTAAGVQVPDIMSSIKVLEKMSKASKAPAKGKRGPRRKKDTAKADSPAQQPPVQ